MPRHVPMAVALVALGAVASAVSAAPAAADASLRGNFVVSTDPPSVWSVMSSACLPTCVARVRSSDGWTGYASLQGPTWTLAVYRGSWTRSSYPANPANCPIAGPEVLVSQTFMIDAVTLTGTVENVRGGQCSGEPTARTTAPVSLQLVA